MKAWGGGGESRRAAALGATWNRCRRGLDVAPRQSQRGSDGRASRPPLPQTTPCAHRRRVSMDGSRRGPRAPPRSRPPGPAFGPAGRPRSTRRAPSHPMSRDTRRELPLGFAAAAPRPQIPPPLPPAAPYAPYGPVRPGGTGQGDRAGPGSGRGHSRAPGGQREGAGGKRRSPLQGTGWKRPSPQSGTRDGRHKGARIGVPPSAAPDGGPTARGVHRGGPAG